MLRTKIFLVLICLSIPHSLLAWEGKITSVIDGDLIMAQHEGREEKLRLFGVDTPDEPQEFGKEAREFTSRSVLGKTVEVEPVSQDRYGNIIAIVSVGGITLNRELAASGLAWVFRGSCTRPECREWRRVEEEARQNGTGLWSAGNPTAPWDFRRSGGNASSNIRGGRAEEAVIYYGDTVTRLYHAPGCAQYKCKSCIVDFKSKKAAETAGYKPCSLCGY